MEDLRDIMGINEMESFEELLEILNDVEKELQKVSPKELSEKSAFGRWAESSNLSFSDEEIEEMVEDKIIKSADRNVQTLYMPDEKLKVLNGKEVYFPQFDAWFKVLVDNDKVVLTDNKSRKITCSIEEFLKMLPKEVNFRSIEAGNNVLKAGDRVKTKSGKYEGYIVNEVGDGQYLVELNEPMNINGKEVRFLVFASNNLIKIAQEPLKPGDVVKRKDEPAGEEMTIVEVDPATGKAKVKSKTTGREQYVDVSYLEQVTGGKIRTAQEYPFKKSEIEIKEEEEEKAEEEIEEEKIKELVEEREEVRKPEADEVLLTETIKTIFTDPEIAVQIVEKLLDLITAKGIEKEFVAKLSSYGLTLDDLLCPVCYKKDGVKIANAFKDVLGMDFVKVIKRSGYNV